MRPALLLVVLLAVLPGAPAVAATWQLAAGPTRSDGSAVELARASDRWDVALGYISRQSVNVRTLQDTCYATLGGPTCITEAWTATRAVGSYGYLSIQRRHSFRRRGSLRPAVGLGLVANSDTNPYVSSPVTFSLSAGLAIGDRWSVEWRHFSNAGLEQPNLGQDMLLFRARFGSD